jgi:ABC-type polysaccharide/polyol phosphate export permease
MDLLRNLYAYRTYLWRNAWNDVRYRHAGTAFGLFWDVANPLLQAAVYAGVFGRFFAAHGRTPEYAYYVCCGLFPWISFSEGLVRGSQSVIRSAPFLRSLPVPTEVIVAESALASCLLLAVLLALLVAAGVARGTGLSAPHLLLPVLALLLHGLTFGLSLGLSALRVLFGEMAELLRYVSWLWMWTLPIVYAERAFGAGAPVWMRFNPPYVFLTAIRGVLAEGRWVSGAEWAEMTAWVVLATIVGRVTERALRVEVQDAL